MADFCYDCYKRMFGDTAGECDLAGLIKKEEVLRGYAAKALCEECGIIQVDHNGRKIPWPDINQWENEGGQ